MAWSTSAEENGGTLRLTMANQCSLTAELQIENILFQGDW